MKKLFTLFIVGLLVAGAASYFGMQWKVRQSVDDFFKAMPLVEGKYDNVSFDLRGNIAVSGIELYVPMVDASISIGSVALSTSGFMAMLNLQRNLKTGRLPDALALKINSFSMIIAPPAFAAGGQGQGTLMAELSALGCGRFVTLGAQQYYDLGFKNINFDLISGYTYDVPSDEFVSSIDFYLDGLGHIKIDQTFIGLAPVMQDFNTALYGFEPATISTMNLHLQYTDLGYNKKLGDYCALASGMARAEWDDRHALMVQSALDQIELSADFDVLAFYQSLRADRARLDINLRPLPGFSLGDLQYYSVADLIDLIELSVVVNDSPVAIGDIDWNPDRLTALNLSAVRKAFRVGPQDSNEAEVLTESSRQERILKDIPVTRLEQYVYRTVQLERSDGQTFSGELTVVTRDRVVIRTRFKTGFTDLPITRNDIRAVKVYPE
ncbi:hypothetical protein [Reinekea sp.]|jgi:hypothetical protein|uniref:hypothetical protein n=1 Tax=Reinekea sp. TaxID=1970455 RepID=UPI002A7F8B1C|nr:hypothetical protein [Reinekea sp.]